jgi:anion-transporting  ArsA/GET3 family ATPase
MIGPPPDLLDRRLLFFTGKGGVGKSTVAAATALLAANIGKRVLLIEVDAKGDIPAQFEQRPVGFEPREVHPGVLAMAMDTEASLQEYLRLNLRVPVLGRVGPLAKALDFVASAAPGVKEILTIGKVCWEVRESIEGRSDIDLVVVDATATGHIVAQLGAPASIRELVDVGPVRAQTQWLSELLEDPAITAVNIVTTPEEMPVVETIELVEQLRAQVPVPLGTVVVNRVLPELFTHADESTFEALREPEVTASLAARAGPGTTAVLDAARLAVSLRRTRAVHLARLLDAVDLPLLYVPYLFVRTHGLRVTRMVADALGEELGL